MKKLFLTVIAALFLATGTLRLAQVVVGHRRKLCSPRLGPARLKMLRYALLFMFALSPALARANSTLLLASIARLMQACNSFNLMPVGIGLLANAA
jgi:hypothetical protein